jgi:hypothetical protein
MEKSNLNQPAVVSLVGAGTVRAMAEREGWTPDTYAISLSEAIRTSLIPLDVQRERIQTLAQVGAGLAGGQASAEELAAHYSVLDALFHRFARSAHEISVNEPLRTYKAAEVYLNVAIKAQRASLSVLSALKVLRDEQRQHESLTTTTTPALTTSEPALMAGASIKVATVQSSDFLADCGQPRQHQEP